jgi:hypothetical protein
MLVKIHKGTRIVVAVCDTELFNKKFFDEDGLRQVDLTGNFFKGEEQNEEQLAEVLLDFKREDASFNIVGEKSCAIALKKKIISKDGIIRIAGIPIALWLL